MYTYYPPEHGCSTLPMKKYLVSFAFAVLFFAGCKQDSGVDDLRKEIEALKSTEIASINSQITGIKTSISDLQKIDAELKGYIKTLQDALAALDGEIDEKYASLQKDIEDLEKADAALSKRIDELKDYCDQQNSSTREWVTTTFTTLEQHSEVLEEIAAIKLQLGELGNSITTLDSSLSKKISDSEDKVMAAIGTTENSVKSWVNEQLSGYYTIAAADAKLKLLEDAYKAGDTSLAGDIKTLQESLNSAKSDLTAAYQKAIADAITENNGTINKKIADDIKASADNLQAQINSINTRIDALESRVAALEASVAELIGMVQSIVVVPDYSDGSVAISRVADNKVRFEVYPLDAAESIAKTGISILSLDYVETITKSTEVFVNLPITAVEFTGKTLLLTVDGTNLSESVLEGGASSANARLRISDGTNTRSSEYFPIYNKRAGSNPKSDIAITGESTDIGESSAKLFGWCNQSGVEGASVVYGIEFSSSDLTTSAITLRASEKDTDNKYYCLVNGLSSNTQYYYRAFTLFNGVRMYGDGKSFTTSDFSATISSYSENVEKTSATISGVLTVVSKEMLSKSAKLYYGTQYSSADELLANGTCVSISLGQDGGFSYNLSKLISGTTYYYIVVATVHDKEFKSPVKSFLTLTPNYPSGAVNLGLSVRWASCNISESGFVSSPEVYGDYYAWGDTETKSDYSWSNYKFGSSNSWKYDTVDNKTVLDPEDDVAHVKLGGNWRMPTDAEWTELRTKCTWSWTAKNGVNGQMVTGPNGNSIFLPAAGYKDGSTGNPVRFRGSYGYYWSSSLHTDYTRYAWYVAFDSDYVNRNGGLRSSGFSVRPVSE